MFSLVICNITLYLCKSYVASGGQVLSTDSQSTATAADSPTRGTYNACSYS